MFLCQIIVTVLQVTEAGACVRDVASLATQAREIQVSGYWYGGNGSTTPVTIRSQTSCVVTMLVRIEEITKAQRDLYLGIGKIGVCCSLCLPSAYGNTLQGVLF